MKENLYAGAESISVVLRASRLPVPRFSSARPDPTAVVIPTMSMRQDRMGTEMGHTFAGLPRTNTVLPRACFESCCAEKVDVADLKSWLPDLSCKLAEVDQPDGQTRGGFRGRHLKTNSKNLPFENRPLDKASLNLPTLVFKYSKSTEFKKELAFPNRNF